MFYNLDWVLDSSLWARDKEEICAVEAPFLTYSKEDNGRFICRVGDAIRLWNAKGIVYWIPSKYLPLSKEINMI